MMAVLPTPDSPSTNIFSRSSLRSGAAAAEVKVEVEEEVEEAPPAVDMFGGGGDGGDY